MPNLEHLVDLVAEQLDSKVESNALYTSLDMRYTYDQVPLDESAAKHSTFQINGGQATGTYRFVTGFNGLTKWFNGTPKGLRNSKKWNMK